MTWINDLKQNAIFGQTVKPQAIAANTNGAAVDCSEMDGEPITAIVDAGVCTDGEYTVTFEESDASGSGFGAIANVEAVAVITSAVDDRILLSRMRRTKRYVRAVVTETSAGTTGVVMAITLVGQKKAV